MKMLQLDMVHRYRTEQTRRVGVIQITVHAAGAADADHAYVERLFRYTDAAEFKAACAKAQAFVDGVQASGHVLSKAMGADIDHSWLATLKPLQAVVDEAP